jgi:DNA replication protein DnaC
MLSQGQRAAILELNTQKVSKREIARVLKISRLTVREVLRSGSAEVGPPGVGKTGLASGLLLKALENGYRCQFIRAQDLFDQM